MELGEWSVVRFSERILCVGSCGNGGGPEKARGQCSSSCVNNDFAGQLVGWKYALNDE